MSETLPKRPGRNERCPCGSGKKYKQCCLAKDAAADREARAEAAAAAAEAATAAAKTEEESVAEEEEAAQGTRPGHVRPSSQEQPWRRAQVHSLGFQKRSSPRRRGGS